MTTLTSHPAAGLTTDAPAAVRLRRLLGACSLPGLFVLMLAGTAIDPLDDSASSSTLFRQATGHVGAVHALAWLELLAAPVCVAGLLTVVGAIRRRGAGWANAVGVLGVFAGIGQAALALNHLVVVGLMGTDLSSAERVDVLEAFHSAGGPIPVLFFVTALAYPLAGVAAWRAGITSRAVLVPSLLFLLTASAPTAGAAQYVPIVVGLVLGGWLAHDLLAEPAS
jgi:hypothetical protein